MGGLTAHNRKRREQEAMGQGGQVTRAQAHLATAIKSVEDLAAKLATAEDHLEAMEVELKAAQEAEKPKAAKKKATKKATAKKGK